MIELKTLIQRRQDGYSLEQPFYNDPEVFTQDMERLVFKRWLLTDHISRIPNVGDYFLFEIADESIIVVRESKENIVAHFNVCRHRGSRLCREKEGNKKRFTCPYHAWTYQKDGALLPPPHMPESFRREDHGLHPCHVRIFKGFIFLCLSKETPPDFSEAYINFAKTMDFHGFENAKVAARKLYPNACNWKLVVENFLECYHCAPSHPEYCSVHSRDQLLALGAGPGSGSDAALAKYQPILDAWSKRTIELGHPMDFVDQDEMTENMAQLSRLPVNDRGFKSETKTGEPASKVPMGKFKTCDEGHTAISFNPMGYILASNDFAMVIRFTPRSATYTDIEVLWIVDENAAEDQDYDVEKMVWVWDETIKQDKRITEDNYAGILSSRYQPGPYGTQEARVETFIKWYLRGISDPAHL